MKPVIWLSLIISFRFLGLFLVMPLISLYAINLGSESGLLVGLAVGGYALVQMFLQYPFGKLSDKFGRKKIILFGLILFAAGSLVCAFSTDIYTLILGRFLQGAGAISSTVTAFISDLVAEDKRSKAMAIVGGSIGMSFIISLMAGPIIGGAYGIGSLFLITAILAVAGIVILFVKVPNPPKITHLTETKGLKEILEHKDLMKLNFSMFFHSIVMTSTFFMIPLVLTDSFGWERGELYKVFIPSVIAGIFAMGIGVMLGEKKGEIKKVFILGIALLTVAYGVISFSSTEAMFIVGVVLIFMGINAIEPIIQSTATKFAKSHIRGSALGVFNAFQFFGVFVGGVIAGVVTKSFGYHGLTLLVFCLSLLWLIFTFFTNNPPMVATIFNENIKESLKTKDGVLEIYFNEDLKKYVVKFDKRVVSKEEIEKELD